MRRLIWIVVFGNVLWPADATAQFSAKVETDESSCDVRAIRWHLPDSFEDALKEARSENRLMMIKGISFGVDEAGSKCATKGKW